MSALRRALSYALVAGFVWLAGALLHVAASRQPVAVLVPKNGPPMFAACRLDSTGAPRLVWFQVHLDR